MFSPVPIAYVLFLSKRGEHRQALLKAGAGLLLGTGLAAVYLLPALGHKSYVSSAKYLREPIYQMAKQFSTSRRTVL
jgi:hypothetical protein